MPLIPGQTHPSSSRFAYPLYFLPKIANAATMISVISMGEFLEGMGLAQFPYGAGFIERFEVLPVDRSVGIQYAQRSRTLRTQGNRIGDNDLAHGQPLVTRHRGDFTRIEQLTILTY